MVTILNASPTCGDGSNGELTTSKNKSKRAIRSGYSRSLLGVILFFAFVVTDSTVSAEKISSEATTVEDAEDFFAAVEQDEEQNHGGGLDEVKREWRRLMSEKLQSKIKHIHNRKLFDASEHAAAGEGVTLPGVGPGGTDASGTDVIFHWMDEGLEKKFSFGNLTYIAGDMMGPHEESLVICLADSYEDRKKNANFVRDLFNSGYLAGKARMQRISSGMQKERDAADAQDRLFQKHVAVHNLSFAEFDKIDNEFGMGKSNYFTCVTGLAYVKSVQCMLLVNYDHFAECAKKTHQIFHDLALEEANKGDLKMAYFYEGLGSHSLTDLFSSGHVRTPSKRLRTTHCSSIRGGFATNMMHDEDSYNGLFMTNRIQSEKWWVYGDSFYFEPFSADNRRMMNNALQGGINEIYAAYEARNSGSSEAIKGSSNGAMYVYPSRSLDFVPDLVVSQNTMPEFWDLNTCPMWYEDKTTDKMYRREPWFRIRSEKGRTMGDSIPASDKFGLFESTFPLVSDANQLTLSGKIDLKINDCWFKYSPETEIWSDECSIFSVWQQSEMFYSPELAGFLPPDLATCQAYTKGGRNDFDNDCYDVLEVVSKGQECSDLTTPAACDLLTPRCAWSAGTWPWYDGTCVQGSCVAYSNEAQDTVPGDPTPPVPVPPQGFYMSFQGSCAFTGLGANSHKKMPGKNNITKCGKICEDYIGPEGECTGIAVDFGRFEECYLYFNNACQRADGPGFLRCASHGLQTFHKGQKSTDEIMSKCNCSASWYYKDQNVIYEGCEAVEEDSWGSWCYLANPDECELGMYSSTQPDQKWRYCEESTCETFECPNNFERRDTVICYDDECTVGDCCVVDPNLKCYDEDRKQSCEAIGCEWEVETGNCVEVDICKISESEDECKKKGCLWEDGWFSDACTNPDQCKMAESKEECEGEGENKKCAWQDGYFSDACTEPYCVNWYNKDDCIAANCAWQDGYISDGCADPLCTKHTTASVCRDNDCAWQEGVFSDACVRPKCENLYTDWECRDKGCAWQEGKMYSACAQPICENWYTEEDCEEADCAWQEGFISSACAEGICENWYTKEDCEEAKCAWQEGFISSACAEGICENWYTKEDCEEAECAWQEGYFSSACAEGICENWYTEEDCEKNDCKWNDGWFSDYCSLNRRLVADEVDESDDDWRRLESDEIDKDYWEGAIETIAADGDIISNLVSPLVSDTQTMSGMLQPKLDAMIQVLMLFDDYKEQLVVFSAFDDGRFYSLTSCDHGLDCWYLYPGAKYTLGVVDPEWNEFINIFQVVGGKVDLSTNSVSEFGVPNFAVEEFHVEDKAWYGKPGWTAPFTCVLMHPDTTEICEAYTIVGADFTLGVQILFSEDGESEDKGENEDEVESEDEGENEDILPSKSSKSMKSSKYGKKDKSGKKGKSDKKGKSGKKDKSGKKGKSGKKDKSFEAM